MLRGESALAYAHRVRTESQHLRAASRSTRHESRALRATATRLQARAGEVATRVPYARVAGARTGGSVHILVRRDGTRVGEPGQPQDPLAATLAAARSCDRVSSVTFHRAGWRTASPVVEAAAHLEHAADPDLRRRVDAVRQHLADVVVRKIFDAGLAATSLLGRGTDAPTKNLLVQLVDDLDEVFADVRFAILHLGAGASRDGASGGSASAPRRHASPFLSLDEAQEGDVHRVRLEGELDAGSAPSLKDHLVDIAGSTVEVDLSGLRFIDVRGLRGLQAAKLEVEANGHELRIVGASGAVRRVFELADLTALLGE